MFQLRNLFVIAVAAIASACSPNTSTIGQHITCTTDPDSGTITSCEPGDGSGGGNECQDIDEDGDGMPGDEDQDDDDQGGIARVSPSEGSGDDDDSDHDGMADCDDDDDDNDGIDDDDDCDEQEGEDGDEADLPYDVKMKQGDSLAPIAAAFAEKGNQPASIVSVEMDGGSAGWRLAELQAGATFTVTAADCGHAGNRDVGRDRVIVRWQNSDGSTHADHLDLRYCD